MPDEIKLLCNECYQPVETVVYPEGVYVEPCVCILDRIEKEGQDAFEDGQQDGQQDGYDDGYYDGHDAGYTEASEELNYKIEELETKLEKDVANRSKMMRNMWIG